MNGWMDGWMDGLMDGWMNKWYGNRPSDVYYSMINQSCDFLP
jgi:hypothetical protein